MCFLFCFFTESQFVILQGTVFVSCDSTLIPLLKANTSQDFPLCFLYFLVQSQQCLVLANFLVNHDHYFPIKHFLKAGSYHSHNKVLNVELLREKHHQ